VKHPNSRLNETKFGRDPVLYALKENTFKLYFTFKTFTMFL